jgi:hypothetical protein
MEEIYNPTPTPSPIPPTPTPSPTPNKDIHEGLFNPPTE